MTVISRKRRYLIVEDHEMLRLMMAHWLIDLFPDSEILQAATGEDGVRIAMAEQPDLILMDIGLPGINGIEATRQIKASAPKIPVIILTIYGEETFRTHALAVGADAFILKRNAMNELYPLLYEFALAGKDMPCAWTGE